MQGRLLRNANQPVFSLNFKHKAGTRPIPWCHSKKSSLHSSCGQPKFAIYSCLKFIPGGGNPTGLQITVSSLFPASYTHKDGCKISHSLRSECSRQSLWMLLSVLSTPTHHCLRDLLASKVVLPSYVTMAASTLRAIAGICDNKVAALHREDGFTTGGGGTEA